MLRNFKNLKPKTKNTLRYYEYLNIIINSFITGFELDINEVIDTDIFWTMLINDGVIGCTYDGKNAHIGNLKYKGGINESGRMTPSGIICMNGNTYEGETVKIKLLNTELPLTTFSRFADRLSEVDLSQEVLVRSTRSGQIIPVNTNTEKARIERAYHNIDQGEIQTYVKTFSIFDDDKRPLELFDPSKFQSMEYLSSYHAELCRRLYGLFGFACQGKNKQAQVSEDELDGQRAPSILLPLTILDNISKAFDEINEKFGVSFSIKPSELLQRQIDDIIRDETEEEQVDLKEGVENEAEGIE